MHASSLHTHPLVLWARIAAQPHWQQIRSLRRITADFPAYAPGGSERDHSICHEATLISCYHATVGRKQWQAEALVTTQRDEKLPRKPQAILRLDPLF